MRRAAAPVTTGGANLASTNDHRRLVILGSGCAGLTAAIYAARADLAPLVVGGVAAGGQLVTTTEVENFPGFPKGILGPDLVAAMREQAARFGAEFLDTDATAVDFSGRPFGVTAGGRTLSADAVIVATGASSRWLGLPAERRLLGHGVSTCATCDGFFFRGRPIAVVGGGDSALEEATFLTKFASKVTLIHRRDAFRASKAMQARALADPKIEVRYDTVVDDILDGGTGAVTGIALRNTKTGAAETLPVDGVFIAIGHVPNTAFLKGQLELDAAGYVVAKERFTVTSVEGVFVAGDCQDHHYRQAITASAMGCMAALDAERWLSAR